MTRPMTLLKAAQHVLAQADTPLHTEELTRRMLTEGLWITQGRTPAASVYSAIFMSLKQQGTSSPFQQTAPSTFGLRPSTATPTPVVPAATPDPETEASDDEVPVAATKTFLDAAEAVLASLPAGQPMRIRELTATALAEGLLVTQGLTPAATMSAQIYQDIDRRQKRGLPPRFQRLQAGFVGLIQSEMQTSDTATDDTAPEPVTFLQQTLLARLKSIDPRDLELLVEKLLAARGYVTVEVTPYSNDGGIDLRAEYTDGLVPERIAVQVKRQQDNVRRPAIQQLRGSLAAHERGLFVTTGSFTKGAREEAQRATAAPIGLMAGEVLAGLLVEHRIGVREVNGHLTLQENLLEDAVPEVEIPEDMFLPQLIRDRMAAGLSVSAINEQGGDDNLWEMDDEVELQLSLRATRELERQIAAQKIIALHQASEIEREALQSRED